MSRRIHWAGKGRLWQGSNHVVVPVRQIFRYHNNISADRMKLFVKYAIGYLTHFTGLNRAIRFFLGLIPRKRRIIIIAFHRIGPGEYGPSESVSPELFEKQVRFISRHFKVISFSEAVSILSGSEPFEEDAIVLTFDDPYRDYHTHLLPILKNYELPAMIFVTTDPIDSGAPPWYDRVHEILTMLDSSGWFSRIDTSSLEDPELKCLSVIAESSGIRKQNGINSFIEHLKSLTNLRKNEIVGHLTAIAKELRLPVEARRTVLNWDEVRELDNGLVTIGSHTCTHPIMSQTTPPDAAVEIEESKSRIESMLCKPVTLFCYPNGLETDFTEENVEKIRSAGYVAACTMIDGVNGRGTSLFHLRRISLGRATVCQVDLKLTMKLLLPQT